MFHVLRHFRNSSPKHLSVFDAARQGHLVGTHARTHKLLLFLQVCCCGADLPPSPSCCHGCVLAAVPLPWGDHNKSPSLSEPSPVRRNVYYIDTVWQRGEKMMSLRVELESLRQTASFVLPMVSTSFSITVSDAAHCPHTLSSCHWCLPELVSHTYASHL